MKHIGILIVLFIALINFLLLSFYHKYIERQVFTPAKVPSLRRPGTEEPALDRFMRLLVEYEKIHADIISRGDVGQIVRWTCSKWCDGWASRLSGIMSVLTASIIHKKAFIVRLEQADVDLTDLYLDNAIRWSYPGPPPLPNLHPLSEVYVECENFDKTCACLGDGILNAKPGHLVAIHSTRDCMDYYVPQFNITGLDIEVPTWKGILMDRFFQLSGKMQYYLSQSIPKTEYDVSVHIRSGFINNFDRVQFDGTPRQLSRAYIWCIKKVFPKPASRAVRIFVASDNATFYHQLSTDVSEFGWGITSDMKWIGDLGHVQLDIRNGPNMVWRMVVDFEVLRRAKLFILAPNSKFSNFAFQTRVYANAKAYTPLGGCKQMFALE